MVTSHPIPHLAKRLPPPPPITVLVMHTDIVRVRLTPALSQTDLKPLLRRHSAVTESVRHHPYSRPRSITPLTPAASDNDDDDTSVRCIMRGQIKRPKGAGRFTLDQLKESLGWTSTQFDTIRVEV